MLQGLGMPKFPSLLDRVEAAALSKLESAEMLMITGDSAAAKNMRDSARAPSVSDDNR